MKCSKGHAFDAAIDGRCPLCGEAVATDDFETYKVTRREWTVVQKALRDAMILVLATEQRWPQVRVVKESIEDAQAVGEMVRERMRYGPRPPKK